MTNQDIQSALSDSGALVDASQAVVDTAMQSALPAALAGSIVQHHHLIKNVDGAFKIALQVEQAAEHIPFLAALPYVKMLPLLGESLTFIEGFLAKFSADSAAAPAVPAATPTP